MSTLQSPSHHTTTTVQMLLPTSSSSSTVSALTSPSAAVVFPHRHSNCPRSFPLELFLTKRRRRRSTVRKSLINLRFVRRMSYTMFLFRIRIGDLRYGVIILLKKR